jgi:hypothetical protein
VGIDAALIAVVFLVSGCVTRGSPLDPPALLVAPTFETRQELAHAVSAALNGASVHVADDAFTTDSYLIITRAQRRDAAGRLLLGRSTEKPERFDLVKHGDACILVQERTARRWRLKSARCIRAADRAALGNALENIGRST